jgi:hypothetical protein
MLLGFRHERLQNNLLCSERSFQLFALLLSQLSGGFVIGFAGFKANYIIPWSSIVTQITDLCVECHSSCFQFYYSLTTTLIMAYGALSLFYLWRAKVVFLVF